MLNPPKSLQQLASIDPSTLTPERRAAFENLIAAGHAAEAAEQDVRDATARLSQCVKAEAEARARLPRVSFMDNWRAFRDTP